MQTARRNLGLIVGVVLAVSLLACGSAGAAGFPKHPKWLKPPYVKYVLHYDATDSTHSTETTSWPDPPEGDPCQTTVSNLDGQGSSEAHIAYDFLFGRSRQGRHLKLAFIWRRVQRSGSSGETGSLNQDVPAGCPEPDYPPELGVVFAHETCVLQGPVELTPGTDGFFAGFAGHGKYLIQLGLGYKMPDDGTCTGNEGTTGTVDFPGPSPTHFGVSAPSGGRLQFTARGIRGRKTFTAPAQHVPMLGEETPTGQGTDPETEESPQRVWSATTTQTGTFVFAPL